MKNSWIILLLALALALSVGSCVSTTKVPPVIIKSPGYLYDSIIVEVQPSTLNEPHAEQLYALKVALEKYRIAERQQIHFIIRPPVETSKTVWFRAELDPYELKYRLLKDDNLEDRNLILWMGFFAGSFLDEQYLRTIGMQYSDSSTAIMGYTNNSTRRVAVMFHEILHAIDMVDLKHRKEKPVNPERPTHCNDEKCVMFWVVTDTPVLCTKCQADVPRRLGN